MVPFDGPVKLMVAEEPAQIVVVPLIVAAGNGFIVTVIVFGTDVQKLPLTPLAVTGKEEEPTKV